MIEAGRFLEAASARGVRLCVGVPCSLLAPLIAAANDSEGLTYVAAPSEGIAVAVAFGAALAGTSSLVLMQNSGLGNAVNPLASLCEPFGVPVLLVCSRRGDPDGPSDEPQHELMGRITPSLLDALGVRCVPFPATDGGIASTLDDALNFMQLTRRSCALVARAGCLAARANRARVARVVAPPAVEGTWGTQRMRRDTLLSVVRRHVPDAALLATAGHIGRALLALGEDERQVCLAGGMGCASAVGFGLALVRPERRVIVLDGDGAALMHLGALSMIGHHAPSNLTHVVLDNEAHESTGGQSTTTTTTDLSAVAAACGFPFVSRIASAEALRTSIDRATGRLAFLHAKVHAESPGELPRPSVAARDVAARFRAWECRAPAQGA